MRKRKVEIEERKQKHLQTFKNTVASLPKVIWEEGRVAALSHTYAVKSPLVTMARPKFAPKSICLLYTSDAADE